MNKSNTNWNLYKTFVTVYETKNMSRSAEMLGISRVAVGQNMRELGNQLGTVLFDAHSKGVEPTASATTLYNNIKGIVEAIYQAEKSVSGANNQEVVKIAISNTIIEIFLKEFLVKFQQNNPNIKLEIFKRENMDLYKQKQLDLILDFKSSVNDKDFRTNDLFSVADVFVATEEFTQTHNIPHTLPLREILRFPIITRDFAWNLFCRENNLNPKDYPLSVSLPSYDLVHSIAGNNPDGIVYYCHQLLKITKMNNIVVLNVPDASYPPIDFVYAYAKNLSRPSRIFLDEYIAFVKNNFL